jgi:hypothetical protein
MTDILISRLIYRFRLWQRAPLTPVGISRMIERAGSLPSSASRLTLARLRHARGFKLANAGGSIPDELQA